MQRFVSVAVAVLMAACVEPPPASSVAQCVQPASVPAMDAANARQKAIEARALAESAQNPAREAQHKGQESGRYVQDGYGMFVGRAGEQGDVPVEVENVR